MKRWLKTTMGGRPMQRSYAFTFDVAQAVIAEVGIALTGVEIVPSHPVVASVQQTVKRRGDGWEEAAKAAAEATRLTDALHKSAKDRQRLAVMLESAEEEVTRLTARWEALEAWSLNTYTDDELTPSGSEKLRKKLIKLEAQR